MIDGQQGAITPIPPLNKDLDSSESAFLDDKDFEMSPDKVTRRSQ
jgi:hypothetical protein